MMRIGEKGDIEWTHCRVCEQHIVEAFLFLCSCSDHLSQQFLVVFISRASIYDIVGLRCLAFVVGVILRSLCLFSFFLLIFFFLLLL